uniref:glycosyltransferase family 32 protein n=1 Tax=Vibrio sp. TaxID=678 RepID=UPI003D14FDF0
MNKMVRVVTNRLIRLSGNLFKMLSYPFHFVFPKLRFTIPEHSPARVQLKQQKQIPRIIWQTNFTAKSTLPVYLNYLFNRLMSLSSEYHYVSTEAREVFLKEHAPKEVYDAYMRLTNGAAQADLWRLMVLYTYGGVYMDIDATLVWPLNDILKQDTDALYIKVSNNTEITNYFIASKPNNPDLKRAIDQVVHNINNYDPKMGVYHS